MIKQHDNHEETAKWSNHCYNDPDPYDVSYDHLCKDCDIFLGIFVIKLITCNDNFNCSNNCNDN